ncbi:MAG: MaoC domain protein dehydratase [Pseudonocardiales bacterium]|nr:MaoC domain protein dehydratase [Pseudonocardiales bacterium]
MRAPRRAGVGDRPASRRIGPITQTHIVRFAGAGGDFNRLHHDPGFASKAGFPNVVAMGQMHAGMLAGFVSDWLGVEHLREFEVRFVAPVLLGDVLELSAEVVSVDGSVAEVDVKATVGGRAVIAGSARAVVAPA